MKALSNKELVEEFKYTCIQGCEMDMSDRIAVLEAELLRRLNGK